MTHVTDVESVEARVRLQPPSPRLMRILNPLVRRVLKTRPLGRRMALQALLEFDGRRTGKRRRVPVCLHDVNGVATVFTERPWRLNFVDRVAVIVTQQGRVRHGWAQLVPVTPGEVGAAMRTAMDNGASPFELGLKVERGYDPTTEDLATIARSVIRIEFSDE